MKVKLPVSWVPSSDLTPLPCSTPSVPFTNTETKHGKPLLFLHLPPFWIFNSAFALPHSSGQNVPTFLWCWVWVCYSKVWRSKVIWHGTLMALDQTRWQSKINLNERSVQITTETPYYPPPRMQRMQYWTFLDR
jgi:hypothetical protein